MRKRNGCLIAVLILSVAMILTACDMLMTEGNGDEPSTTPDVGSKKELITVLNDNIPYFTEDDYANAEKTGYFISLAPLDELGRTGVTWGLFDYGHMPTEEREPLDTTPSGWVQNRYSTDLVEGGWLYNRSHQIGFQISGLNDIPENLMTGTRMFNTPGMLQFEDMTADHMRDQRSHHVLYRVTPDFKGNNLLAYGVTMESDCLECDGADYCVYIANIQPGITIDYATGKNWESGTDTEDPSVLPGAQDYVVNRSNGKFHLPTCRYAESMNATNREEIRAPRSWMIANGCDPCGVCNP